MNKDFVSLEVALKLQKVGWYQNTDLRYVYNAKTGEFCDIALLRVEEWPIKSIPAPTAVQLAEELLNLSLRSENHELSFGGYHTGTFKNVYATLKYDSHVNKHIEAESLPDALGLMMCYLLENKLITNEHPL